MGRSLLLLIKKHAPAIAFAIQVAEQYGHLTYVIVNRLVQARALIKLASYDRYGHVAAN